MLDWCVDCSRGVKHIGAVPVGCGGCGRTSHLHISHYLSISHAFSSDAIQRHHHQSLLSPSFKIQFQSKIRTTNIHAEKWHWWTRGFRKEHLLPTSNYDDDSIKKERKLHNYRSQVSLGSGLWVPVSLTPSVQHLFETSLMWLWLMMIPTQYDWWCNIKQSLAIRNQCHICKSH